MSTSKVEIIPRDVWGADPPRSRQSLELPVTYVFCAMQTECEPCTDTEHCQSLVREMQFEHAQMEKLPDIKYNFIIGGDNKIYEGRGWNLIPTLPDRYTHLNSKSIYLAFIGNLYGKNPSREILDARDEIIKFGLLNGYIKLKFSEFLMLTDGVLVKE